MKFEKTKLHGVSIVHFEPKKDERGYFERIFCHKEFAQAGIPWTIVQISRSITRNKGTIRGMHFQTKPCEEDKLVQCTKGSIYDVVVDVRNNSRTYGQWISQELNPSNNIALFIPHGCAHGFQTIENDSEVLYFISESYSPNHTSGVRWNDPFLHITWPHTVTFVSPQDSLWPLLKNIHIQT